MGTVRLAVQLASQLNCSTVTVHVYPSARHPAQQMVGRATAGRIHTQKDGALHGYPYIMFWALAPSSLALERMARWSAVEEPKVASGSMLAICHVSGHGKPPRVIATYCDIVIISPFTNRELGGHVASIHCIALH